MLTMIIILTAAFALSVIPTAELPGLKRGKLVFWSINPVICGNM